MSINASSLVSVPLLTGTNYKQWIKDLEISLGMLDLDMGIMEDKPAELTYSSTPEEKQYMEKWKNANKKCLLMIRRYVPDSILDGIEGKETAKSLLKGIKARYEETEKAQMGTLMAKLSTTVYDGKGNVTDHLVGLAGIAEKLRNIGHAVDKDHLVYLAMKSLPNEYKHIKVAYRTSRTKWTLDELIAACTEDEENDKKGTIESMNATLYKNNSDKGTRQQGFGPHKRGKYFSDKARKPYDKEKDDKEQHEETDLSDIKCFWCQKRGHMKRDCKSRKRWLEKKKNSGKSKEDDAQKE